MIVQVILHLLQKVKAVFPVAEEIKGKLTVRYTEQERKKQEEEVG